MPRDLNGSMCTRSASSCGSYTRWKRFVRPSVCQPASQLVSSSTRQLVTGRQALPVTTITAPPPPTTPTTPNTHTLTPHHNPPQPATPGLLVALRRPDHFAGGQRGPPPARAAGLSVGDHHASLLARRPSCAPDVCAGAGGAEGDSGPDDDRRGPSVHEPRQPRRWRYGWRHGRRREPGLRPQWQPEWEEQQLRTRWRWRWRRWWLGG